MLVYMRLLLRGDEMFLILGSKWKYEIKANGLKLNMRCPSCNEFATFKEVVPSEYFAVFGMPIYCTKTEKSVLECPSCKNRYHIQTEHYYEATKQLK